MVYLSEREKDNINITDLMEFNLITRNIIKDLLTCKKVLCYIKFYIKLYLLSLLHTYKTVKLMNHCASKQKHTLCTENKASSPCKQFSCRHVVEKLVAANQNVCTLSVQTF